MDDLSLLCETCGYPIDGLRLAAPAGPVSTPTPNPVRQSDRPPHCPECGTPIADSLPNRRTGSAWQQRPGFFSWVRTSYATITRPTETFRNIRIQRRTKGLWFLNPLVAGLLIAPSISGVLVDDPARIWRGSGGVSEFLAWIGSIARNSLIVASVFVVLTTVEYFGIRFFARRRRWRLSRDSAEQVCAHASVGWIAAGILPYLFAPAAVVMVQWFGLAEKRIDFSPVLPYASPASGVASIIGFALGLLAGMTAFEWLVYLGVRQNRFANHAETPLVSTAEVPAPPAANPTNS